MLSSAHRLKGKKDFGNLYRTGKTFSNDVLILKISSGEKDSPAKFGFAASLKFSKKATERNKVKRWMREAVRPSIGKIQSGRIAIFFVNPKFPKDKLNFELIRKNIEDLLKKAKIYPRTNS